MLRLFAAIEIPDEQRAALARLRAPLPGARWVEADNLHLTLRFAGDIDNRTAQEFADGLAGLDVGCFELAIVGLGAFGGNDPKLLWAGVAASPALDALARGGERAARAAGLPPEPRAFKPHVTLARMRHGRPEQVARYLERNARFALEPFTVERFVLMSSRPNVGGGPYVVEEAYTLAGAAPHDDWPDTDRAW